MFHSLINGLLYAIFLLLLLVLIGAGRLKNIVSWNEDFVGTSFNKLFRQSELEALLIVFVIFLVTLLIKQLPQVKRVVKSIEEHFSDFELSNQWFAKKLN